MSRRLAWTLLALLLLTLVVGTQIPGALRDGIERRMHAPSALSSWAHFAIFAAMALVLSMRPLAWPMGRVLLPGNECCSSSQSRVSSGALAVVHAAC